jgi:hypothetical protein
LTPLSLKNSQPSSGLYPDPKNGDLLIYEKDKEVLKNFHKFLLEPITVYLLPEAEDRGIDPDDLPPGSILR